MAGKFRITGPDSGIEATVYTPQKEDHLKIPGLVTYTHPLEVGSPLLRFFQDENGSVDQNTNASGAGTLTGIHNGTDAVQWTAAGTVGTWDFASTAQANSGTRSIDATGTRNGDVATFTNASALTITDYETLRGFIYITSWPGSGNKNFSIQLVLSNTPIGSAVNLSAYIDTNVSGSWQVFEIPMQDFGVTAQTTFDAMLLNVIDSGQGSAPKAYFDDIALVGLGTGGSTTYTVKPNVGEIMVINRIKFTAVSTSSSIKYNEFFGIAELTNGYVLNFSSASGSQQSFLARNFFEMAQYPNVTLDIISGTASIFEVYFDIPAEQQTLNGNLGQSLNIIVRDDLSSMTELRAAVQGYIRETV